MFIEGGHKAVMEEIKEQISPIEKYEKPIMSFVLCVAVTLMYLLYPNQLFYNIIMNLIYSGSLLVVLLNNWECDDDYYIRVFKGINIIILILLVVFFIIYIWYFLMYFGKGYEIIDIYHRVSLITPLLLFLSGIVQTLNILKSRKSK